ncbi:MAG: bifunctional prephenate dehydrogenase/3-phosphoshikimate 1-carboxyvinyltransferase [Cellvibrionaceae bacterium]|nr:bifunctional prephenate dehydrogenase/3-phosphoshikimate 1-carboxyvinyltransferase [Cellvibrionaceae bacterium]
MKQQRLSKLLIIGLGLIGGSLAAAIKKRGDQREVIAVVRRPETAAVALEKGIVDRAEVSLAAVADELGAGDIIFIATPTLSVSGVLEEIHRLVDPAVTITDGASVKGSVVNGAMAIYGQFPAQFVPGHPIAGSEKTGIEAVDADLYERHRVILTPLPETADAHTQRVSALWCATGAEVLTMSVEEHDVVLASTSHLPHAIAYSLVDTLANDSENENIFRYAAGGFRDFTRIASSDPRMWHDIMLANRSAILDSIDLFQNNLQQLRSAIATENGEDLLAIFTRANVARDHFSALIEDRRLKPSQPSLQQQYPKHAMSASIKSLETKFSETGSSENKPSDSHMMRYIVQPGGQLSGAFRVPGDKSMSHRSIMLGSIAEGITEVAGFLQGEDALATLEAFRAMGVIIEGPDNGRLRIHGVGLHGLKPPAEALYVGNAGTAMRLLAGVMAGQNFTTTLTGDRSLSKRPMNRVANPLREMGVHVDTQEEGRPPITIQGAKPKAIHYQMPMASAQVKSCVLLAGLYAEGETSVIEPAPTRDHTERMLRGFAYPVTTEGNRVSLVGGGVLQAMSIDVPADISSAAFFMVAASIAPGSDITLEHVGVNPTRDGIIHILRLMGADISLLNPREVGGEPVADIRIRYADLKAINIPEDLVPLAIDEFPVLFIAAACAEGTTVLTGAQELRVKESDRIQVMAEGLQSLGVNAQPTPDGMIIEGGALSGGTVETHDDHRIAMSFTVAALRACAPITVNNCAHVATSFPGFVELARRTGIRIEQQVV